MDSIDALSEKFEKIKEKYGDDYPIIIYEPAIKCEENEALKDLIERNTLLHVFTEFIEAVKFAHSLGISFILIVSNEFDEQHVLLNFGSGENIYGRAIFDFEEEGLLRNILKGISDQIRESLKVYVFFTLLDHLTEAKVKESEEEVMVMCNIKDIAKKFCQEFILIWYDPDKNLEMKQRLEEEIEMKIEEGNTYTQFADLHERIKRETTPYHLIMSRGDEAEKILKEIDHHKDLLGLYICWKNLKMDKIKINERVEIGSTIEELVPRIKEGIRIRLKLKNMFPAFATNFDSSDRTGIYKIHFYLQGLINFQNRNQAKEDFIKLAREIEKDEEKQLERFQSQYNEYNKAEIFRWYTSNSLIYKVINNCLRISSSDSILYCRLILKDLERAIREQYKEKSKDFNGVVYRGAYIATDEWEKLKRNIGEEIEMYGFLSTSVNQKTAVNFLRADPKNKIFIKIIIPSLPELDEQGFADISEFSQFPKEAEVLFNVRSRFKILQAEVSTMDNQGTECRQLVLLYGTRLLRKYITEKKPSIEIKLELPPEIKCHQCGSKEKLFGFKQQEETSVHCLKCLVKYSMPQDTPLVALEGENKKRIERSLPGKFLVSQEGVKFSNCGYQCHDCEAKGKDKYYKWMSCDGENVLIQCSECLGKKIAIENKILISEGSPYTIWRERQKKWETVSDDYQGAVSRIIGRENQGRVEIEVEDYDRCIEYGEKAIDKFSNKRRRENFKLQHFYVLGDASLKLGKYPQALRYFINCLGLLNLVGRGEVSKRVCLNCKIADVHCYLAEYQEALKYFQQALILQIFVFGENHPGIIAPCLGLAFVYDSLSEHQKASEYFKKTIIIQKSIFGGYHPRLAATYQALASHFHNLAKYEEALIYFKMAHHMIKSIFGKNHSRTARSYNSLASFYQQVEKFDEAKKLSLKVIKIQENLHGAKYLDITDVYSNLANIYKRLGRSKEALEYFNQVLETHKSVHGENHPETAHVLNFIGDFYLSVGNYQEALKHFQTALNINKSFFGEKHASVAIFYNNIAGVHSALGNYKEALAHYQKVLDIQKHIYPKFHPSIALSYSNLACVQDTLGDYQKALENYSTALIILESVYQDKHPDIAITYQNLGLVYENLEDGLKAVEFLNKAIDIQLAIFGKKSPEIAFSYSNLGKVYARLNECLKAVNYLQVALDLQLSIYGEDHPSTLTTSCNLGEVYHRMGKHKEAAELQAKILKKRIAIFGEIHPDTADSYNNLGLAYRSLQHYEQALEYHTKALKARKLTLGEKHKDTAYSYYALAYVYVHLKKDEKAREYFVKALNATLSIHHENSSKVVDLYHNLAAVHERLKNFDQALEYFSKALKLQKAIYGEKHPETVNLYDRIGSVYCRLREFQKALKYHTKALKLRKSIYQENHLDIGTSYRKIGFLYFVCFDFQNARDNYRKGLDILKPLYGDQHLKTAFINEAFLAACALVGNDKEA